MKENILILALDGLSINLMQKLNYLDNSYFKNFNLKNVEADLLSRGWAEWISGKSGYEINALYSMPQGNNDWSFTQKYEISDYLKNESKPIWESLNELDLSVGLFGLPTTYPAPSVKGYCISGSGAGFDQSSGISEKAVNPKKLLHEIKDFGGLYPEIRFSNGKYTSKNDFLRDESIGLIKRSKLFTFLSKKYSTDVNIFFDKYFAHLAWICMGEIELYYQGKLKKNKFLIEHLNAFNEALNNIIQDLKPAGVILISDHGVQKRNYSINMNKFLEKVGLIKKASITKRARILSKKFLKKIIPTSFHKPLASKFLTNKSRTGIPGNGIYDESRSFLFAARYIPGLFINTSRFGGNVDSDQIEFYRKYLKDLISDNAILKKIGIKVDLNALNSKMAINLGKEFIPLTEPEGFFFEDNGKMVLKNNFLDKQDDQIPGGSSMLTGIKQRDAIFGFNFGDKLNFIDGIFKECNNLTQSNFATLSIIKKYFKK
jgi:hypothetical protein